jgi:predicted metal-binding membrane protein
MAILLSLGIMNPLVMIGVTIVIAAEKVLPRPAIVARFVGILAVVAGITFIARTLQASL